MKLHVAVIAASWYPRLSARAIQNLRLFGEIKEWDVSVYTLKHTSKPVSEARMEKKLKRINTEYISVPSTPLFSRFLGRFNLSLANTPDRFKAWSGKAANAILSGAKKPNLIFSVSNPLSGHLAGLELKEKMPDVPWMAFFSDPWTHWGDTNFRKDNAIERKENWRLEKEVIRKADALLFPTLEMANYFGSFHPVMKDKAVHILPQTFESDDLQSSIVPNFEKPLTVRYVGSWYKERKPEKLFEILELFKQRFPDQFTLLQFELIGHMDHKESYADTMKELGIKQVDMVPNHEATKLINSTDILLHVGVPSPQDFYRPSKLVDYLTARKPILCLSSPGAEENFTKNAKGFYGSIFDDESMVKALNDLCDAYSQGNLANHIPDTEFINNFEASHVAGQLENFASDLVQTYHAS